MPRRAAKQLNKEFGPGIALANMMLLSLKINELRFFVDKKKPDLVSLTENWIYDSYACENHLHISGYNLILKNRTVGIHGGVGLYINSKIKFKALTDLYHPNFEVLWAHLRPPRLPRGYPALSLELCTILSILKVPATVRCCYICRPHSRPLRAYFLNVASYWLMTLAA